MISVHPWLAAAIGGQYPVYPVGVITPEQARNRIVVLNDDICEHALRNGVSREDIGRATLALRFASGSLGSDELDDLIYETPAFLRGRICKQEDTGTLCHVATMFRDEDADELINSLSLLCEQHSLGHGYIATVPDASGRRCWDMFDDKYYCPISGVLVGGRNHSDFAAMLILCRKMFSYGQIRSDCACEEGCVCKDGETGECMYNTAECACFREGGDEDGDDRMEA
jgi:hypothetical protein